MQALVGSGVRAARAMKAMGGNLEEQLNACSKSVVEKARLGSLTAIQVGEATSSAVRSAGGSELQV